MKVLEAALAVMLLVVVAMALFTVSYSVSTQKAANAEFIQQGSLGNPPAIITPISNGYDVSNISEINPFIIIINGSLFRLSVNYITPSGVGLLINGSVYTLNANKPVQIRQTPVYNFYAELSNTTTFSKIQTANVLFYSETRAPSYQINLTYNLTSHPLVLSTAGINASVAISSPNAATARILVSNVTHFAANIPLNYEPVLVLNISISSPNVSNLIISATMNYSCSIVAGAIRPYKLISGTWTPISQYSLNRKGCSMTFRVPPDPIVGIFQNTTYVSPTIITLLTSVPTTAATTTVQPVIQKTSPGTVASGWWIATILVIVIIVIAILAYALLKRPKGRGSPKKPPAAGRRKISVNEQSD
jgi:hypothetical protein